MRREITGRGLLLTGTLTVAQGLPNCLHKVRNGPKWHSSGIGTQVRQMVQLLPILSTLASQNGHSLLIEEERIN